MGRFFLFLSSFFPLHPPPSSPTSSSPCAHRLFLISIVINITLCLNKQNPLHHSTRALCVPHHALPPDPAVAPFYLLLFFIPFCVPRREYRFCVYTLGREVITAPSLRAFFFFFLNTQADAFVFCSCRSSWSSW